MNIKNVVVIGSGTMGSGIAAQLCSANVPVTLLDLKTEISEKAKKKIFESRPPLLIDKNKIDNIKVGNIDENFDTVKKADWVVEAVVERIDIKHNLYEKILKTRKKDSIISSNTSTIPLKVLSAKMSDEDKKDFCITHFFNPVRYMGLLEIVSENINDTKKISFLKNYGNDDLITINEIVKLFNKYYFKKNKRYFIAKFKSNIVNINKINNKKNSIFSKKNLIKFLKNYIKESLR